MKGGELSSMKCVCQLLHTRTSFLWGVRAPKKMSRLCQHLIMDMSACEFATGRDRLTPQRTSQWTGHGDTSTFIAVLVQIFETESQLLSCRS